MLTVGLKFKIKIMLIKTKASFQKRHFFNSHMSDHSFYIFLFLIENPEEEEDFRYETLREQGRSSRGTRQEIDEGWR